MKALSIRQPWAWNIVYNGKFIENRSWRTNYRGPILIHASQSMTRAYYENAANFVLSNGLVRPGKFPEYERLKQQCGGIVGQAIIADCVERSDSPWFMGKYGWILTDVAPLEFKLAKGRLSFFEMDYDKL